MDDRSLMSAAIEAEAEGQRALLAGEPAGASFGAAAERYRASWEAAGPRAFGRLIGMLKAAVLAGDATDAARYAREAVADADSPPSAYALAIAALVAGDDDAATRHAAAMAAGGPVFERTAEAIGALACGDAARYATAVRAIVSDFERRDEHLTGVAFADTALMLERLAEGRGIAAHPESPVLPPPRALS